MLLLILSLFLFEEDKMLLFGLTISILFLFSNRIVLRAEKLKISIANQTAIVALGAVLMALCFLFFQFQIDVSNRICCICLVGFLVEEAWVLVRDHFLNQKLAKKLEFFLRSLLFRMKLGSSVDSALLELSFADSDLCKIKYELCRLVTFLPQNEKLDRHQQTELTFLIPIAERIEKIAISGEQQVAAFEEFLRLRRKALEIKLKIEKATLGPRMQATILSFAFLAMAIIECVLQGTENVIVFVSLGAPLLVLGTVLMIRGTNRIRWTI